MGEKLRRLIRDLPKIKWIKHTQFHWQAKFGNTIFDYWPPKIKWGWRGLIHEGHSMGQRHHRAVREFILDHGLHLAKPGRCAECMFWKRSRDSLDDPVGECSAKTLLPDEEAALTLSGEWCEKFDGGVP